MEFFATIDAAADAPALQKLLRIDRLADYCASIEKILMHDGDAGRIYCVWGEFGVRREEIRGGVRFLLPTCPNALSWTITTDLPPAPEKVVIHCTINRTEHDPEFIATLRTFVDDWKRGLERGLPG